MKISFLYHTVERPFGGANQFLAQLKERLIEHGLYTDRIPDSDVLLFNSHLLGAGGRTNFFSLARLRKRYPRKVFVHRVDGPISLYRGEKTNSLDKKIYQLNQSVADGTIFQSEWSRKQNYATGMQRKEFETVIWNAADPLVFFQKKRTKKEEKIRIVLTSWSSHWNKGFEVYRYLDDHLDFSRFDVVFVGNAPITFHHIRMKSPLGRSELAHELQQADIYLTASLYDPCSNSLIEAIQTGLFPLVIQSGGHPELVQYEPDFIFNGTDDVIDKINTLVSRYMKNHLVLPLKNPTFDEVADTYVKFCKQIFDRAQIGEYHPTHLSFYDMITLALL